MRDTPPGENAEMSPDNGSPAGKEADADWPALARAAYDASTNWLNASRRKGWADSLRMFQGEHPAGSKYLGPEYRYRSRLFRPKARATVRKTEAATAQAFFSNDDVLAIKAQNPDDPKQQASARLMKELMQIRLTQNIPWFQILIGARQDCEVYGLCVSRQYWRYEERQIGTERRDVADQFGNPVLDDMGVPTTEDYNLFEIVADHPDIALIAPDNFRLDPACDWARPVDTSPYLIERIPMFVGDVRVKMSAGEWKEFDDAAILSSKGRSEDGTRGEREAGRQDSMDAQASGVRDFDVAWVHLNTIRWKGKDYVFFTLGPDKLLTEPRPHVEVYGTERRPYRVGITNLEAHRNYPASKNEILKDLQAQANDTANLRLDAMKYSLMPRPKVKLGTTSAQNLADFRVFMPGKPILVGAMDDVDWDRPPDVSQAAFLEQDRVNADFDELAGSAAQSMVTSPGAANETLGGMELLSGMAGLVGEYELRLFVETWVRGVLEDLIDLEQRLEDDETILSLAGEKAELVQRYGLDVIEDWMLSQRFTLAVNVGVGSTNPMMQLQQMKIAGETLTALFGPSIGMGLKFDEVCKIVFGAIGQADGKRFFVEGFDPRQAAMEMEQNKQSPFVDPHKTEEVQIKANTDLQTTQMRTDSAERIAAMKTGGDANQPDPAKLTEAQLKAAGEMRKSALQAASHERVAQIRMQTEREKQTAETHRAMLQHQADIKGNVIRTLPPAMAKLLVAKEQAKTRPRSAA